MSEIDLIMSKMGHKIDSLESEKKELLEALEKAYEYLEEIGMVVPNKEWTEQFRDRWNRKLNEIESLIQKHKQ